MDIWKGAFTGLFKHRDFEHASFGEHAREDGAMLGLATEDGEYLDPPDYDEDDLDDVLLDELREAAEQLKRHWMDVNPITGLKLENPALYNALVMILSEKQYVYFIPAPDNGLPPPRSLVIRVLDEYMANHIDREELLARHIEEYS